MADPINMTVLFAELRRSLWRNGLPQRAVDGLNVLVGLWRSSYADLSLPMAAYVLATAYHETAHTMQPVREIGRGRGRRYGVRDEQTGQTYYGRGYVQLTWRENYAKAGLRLGIDLVLEPDLALRPGIAARILFEGMRDGWFTGKRLAEFQFGVGSFDFEGARAIVNGRDRAQLIAGYARAFEDALRQAFDRKPVPADVVDAAPAGKPPATSTTVWSQIGAMLSAIGAPVVTALAGVPWQTVAVISAALVVAAAAWTIRERLRHRREAGL
jgi:hypothetical protein